MAGNRAITPQAGGWDMLGTEAKPWEEVHVETLYAGSLYGGISVSSDTPEFLGLEKEIWISLRTDAPAAGGIVAGVGGTGLQYDPFDGSTQPKLDAIFIHYHDLGVTGITFHIGPGTYTMIGGWDDDWGMLNGWHVKGAGKDKTKITQIVGTALTGMGALFARIGEITDLNSDNSSVEDLWCDLAYFRKGPAADGGDNSRPLGNFYGISLYGSDCKVRRIKVTGAGWAVNETFAIHINGGWETLAGVTYDHIPDNALIEECDVSECGANVSPLTISNLAAHGNIADPIYASNGRIINCTAEGGNNGAGPPAGFDSGELSGCTLTGLLYGIFYDTFGGKNIHIYNNKVTSLHANGNGIIFNTGLAVLDGFLIYGNTVSSASGIGAISFFQNGKIYGNRIIRPSTVNNNAYIFLHDGLEATFTAAATDLITAVAHGLKATNKVRFTTTTTLPSGLDLLTDYYVRSGSLTADTFTVSAVLDGASVNIADTGTGTHTFHRQSVYGNSVTDNTTDVGTPVFSAIAIDANNYTKGNRDTLTTLTIADTIDNDRWPSIAFRDNGSVAVVVADTVTGLFGLNSGFNDNDIMDATSDVIIAPADGRLVVDFTLMLSVVTSTGFLQLHADPNNGDPVRYARYQAPIIEQSYHLHAAFDLDAGDTVAMRIENQTGASLTYSALGQFSYVRAQFFPS